MNRMGFLLGWGLLFPIVLLGQDTSVATDSLETTVTLIKESALPSAEGELAPARHSPTKAAWRAAVLPGWGQIYNRKYWKLPLVYGGLGGLGYWVGFNASEHRLYRNAYLAKTDEDPLTEDPFPAVAAESVLRTREFYRRQMDASILVTVAFYGLQIVDAVVDAHLFDFNVGDDLSLHYQPWLPLRPMYGAGPASVAGVHLQLTWK